MSAENALGVQSLEHRDGWGVAYYVAGAPHLIKSAAAAYEDRLFSRVSGIVASETVVAHVRRASVGEVSLINSHPFQHGRWVFAHNGEVVQFAEVKEELLDKVAPRLRRYILGDTDSEVVFYLFLTLLAGREELHRAGADIANVADSLRETLHTIFEVSSRAGLPTPRLTTIVTDGTLMVATCFGRELHRSTYKRRCPERDTCPSLVFECENRAPNGIVSHFILSSEPLQGFNVWEPLDNGAIVGCDGRMRVYEWVL